MPVTTADIGHAKALYLKGMPPKEIAKQTGIGYRALTQRIYRERWREQLTEANKAVSQSVVERLKVSSEQWLGKIDTYVHSALDNIMQRPLDALTTKQLVELTQAAKNTNEMARSNLGLDKQDNAKVAISIAVDMRGEQRHYGKVIDVDGIPVGDDAKPLGKSVDASANTEHDHGG